MEEDEAPNKESSFSKQPKDGFGFKNTSGNFSITNVPDESNVKCTEDQETVFKIVMLRCGDIDWDLRNIYCGWYDAKLNPEGRQQIITACDSLKLDNYTFDLAYCSVLSRCRESLTILLSQLGIEDIEIIPSWELNERHCGCLTGYKQDEIIAKYGAEQINFWMHSYSNSPPPILQSHKYYEHIYNNEFYPNDIEMPLTESLESIQQRLINFWNKTICPNILSGRQIIIVTHNGCLQALIQYLDDIEYKDFTDTEIPKSTPFYYKLDETLTPILKDIHPTNELEKKIADAFEIFDHAGNKNADIREVGTIIRALGCVPTEEELQEILIITENRESRGNVSLNAFLPQMVKVFNEHKFQPATPDKLLEAFRKLDPEGHGYVGREFLTKLMMEEGEPFTEDEIEEMMSTACDPQTQTIPYEYYINQLMYDPPNENNLYWWADKIQAEKPKEAKKKTMSEMLRLTQVYDDFED